MNSPLSTDEYVTLGLVRKHRADAESAINKAMCEFLKATGLPECQVTAVWDRCTVQHYDGRQTEGGHTAFVKVVL